MFHRGSRFLSSWLEGERVRKAFAGLDAEQRAMLLYVIDLGLAAFSSALVVSLLKFIVDLV